MGMHGPDPLRLARDYRPNVAWTNKWQGTYQVLAMQEAPESLWWQQGTLIRVLERRADVWVP